MMAMEVMVMAMMMVVMMTMMMVMMMMTLSSSRGELATLPVCPSASAHSVPQTK